MLLLKAMGGLAMAAGIVSAVTHEIEVGRLGGHRFEPQETEAEVGDIIRFHFWPQNHSVARAEYMLPCQPIEYSTIGHEPSFWSGFLPVAEAEKGPFFDVQVNDSEPIWVYCSQATACWKDHMVGVIWVGGNKTDVDGNAFNITAHSEATTLFETSGEISPGQQYASEGGLPKTPTQDTDNDGHAEVEPHPHGLSKGAIAGIVVGAVAAVVFIAILVYLFGRNKSLADTLRYSRPPAGKIAPLPMSEGASSPYPPSSFPASPAFPQETKMAPPMGVPAPGYNHQANNHTGHQSWMSQSSTMRAQSPDNMTERGYGNGGLMSPNAFSPHNSYSSMTPEQQQQMALFQQQQQQQQQGGYHVQSSPSETPWSPGGYNWQNMQGQQQHEMGAGQEGIAFQRQSQMQQGNNGYPTPSHLAPPVELAGDTSENVMTAAPPVYRPTLAEGEEAQKPEDKTPAVTTRDA